MIYCVIVTYGQRRDLLLATLRAALASGVDRSVVVDNGAHWAVSEELQNTFPQRVDVICLLKNRGSAPGFRAGIARAMELGADHLLILDDDLAIEAATLHQLQQSLEDLAKTRGLPKSAVCAYRNSTMERMIKIEGKNLAHSVAPPILRFGGSLLLKSLRSVISGEWQDDFAARGPAPSHHGTVAIPFAPYGGLFMHRSAVNLIGLPDERFGLYWDDIEWTYRITSNGGIIVIDCDAPLNELEISLPFRSKHVSRFHSLLLRDAGPSDYRIYYEIRNAIYFSSHSAQSQIPLLRTRIFFFRMGILITALILRRTHRGRTICKAVSDGLSGALGYNAEFPFE